VRGGHQVPRANLQKGAAFLDSKAFDPDKLKAGLLSVTGQDIDIAAAAAGAVAFGRSRKDIRLLAVVDSLAKQPPKWDGEQGPLYWYLGSEAVYEHENPKWGPKWQGWVKSLKDALLDKQAVGTCADGSWPPVGPYGRKVGRVGTTALCCMSLEVYYRYAILHPGPHMTRDMWQKRTEPEVMNCPNCGRSILKSSAKCPWCGRTIKGK
jgi:hypothetical protein